MSAATYLKAAATDLRKAIQEKRVEIDMLRKQITEKEQMVRQYIDQLRQNQQQKESLAASGSIDNDQRVDLEKAAQEDLSEVSNTEQSFSQDRDHIQRAIDNIERDIYNLDQLARELEARN